MLTWLRNGEPAMIHQMGRRACEGGWAGAWKPQVGGTMVQDPGGLDCVWPAALRVIEAAVSAQPDMAEDVAGAIAPALGGHVQAVRWIVSMKDCASG